MTNGDLKAILRFTQDLPSLLPHVITIYKLGFYRGIAHEIKIENNERRAKLAALKGDYARN